METKIINFLESCCQSLSKESLNFLKDETENFVNEGYGSCDSGCSSPIEQVLFIALLYNIKFNKIKEAEPESIGDYDFVFGIKIDPQEPIGKYRTDFKVSMEKYIYNRKSNSFLDESKSVFIECDSQEWHERTEKERRYEKARDRYFAKNNLKIFHYTGAEILKTPHEVAAEIISEVAGYDCSIDQD